MNDRRTQIQTLLQSLGPADVDKPAVLTGWVVVTEWMDDDGERWLSRGWATGKTSWDVNGMLHEVLHGDWSEQ